MEAAHFCYLTAHVPFGHYTVKTDHLALLGSSHRYVTFAGEGHGKDVFFLDYFSTCWLPWLHYSFSCVNLSLLLALPLYLLLMSRQGDQRVPHHTTRGPEPVSLVCIEP